MASTTKTWTNNSAPACEDVDLNGFKDENNNLIEGSGQTLNTGDLQQTHKAVSHYAAAGQYYTESGAADAYVLTPVGSQVSPPAYVAGMRVRFVPGASCTGGAVTVNVAGLGIKTVQFYGVVPGVGDIEAGSLTELEYDGTNFQIVPFVGIKDYRSVKRGRNGIVNGGCVIAQTAAVTLTDTAQYGAVDMFLGYADTVPAAGTLTQAATSTLGETGYALHFSGVTMAPASNTITTEQRRISRDVLSFSNKAAILSCLVEHDVGVNVDYTLRVYRPATQDDFGSVMTQISVDSTVSVASGTPTRLELPVADLGDCSKGLMIEVRKDTGAITTKNFFETEFQLEEGSSRTAFDKKDFHEYESDCNVFYRKIEGHAHDSQGVSVDVVYTAYLPYQGIPLSPAMWTTPAVTTANLVVITGLASVVALAGAYSSSSVIAYVQKTSGSWVSGSNNYRFDLLADARP